jgi:hypothetical protein
MQVKVNGVDTEVFEMGKYYAYSDEHVKKNYSNIITWDIFKQFNEKSFARIDYIKEYKLLIILLFRKDTSKKFLKALLKELSKSIEIKEIIYQDKIFENIENVVL